MKQQTHPTNYVELLKTDDVDDKVLSSASSILNAILSAKAPSEDSVSLLLNTVSPCFEKYASSNLEGISVNEDSETHNFELEALQVKSSSEQIKLLKNHTSHRYIAALFFDNKQKVLMSLPGLDLRLELMPDSVLILPVSLTYRFMLEHNKFPISALCVYATMQYEKE